MVRGRVNTHTYTSETFYPPVHHEGNQDEVLLELRPTFLVSSVYHAEELNDGRQYRVAFLSA